MKLLRKGGMDAARVDCKGNAGSRRPESGRFLRRQPEAPFLVTTADVAPSSASGLRRRLFS
jgi:hypothetical protein